MGQKIDILALKKTRLDQLPAAFKEAPWQKADQKAFECCTWYMVYGKVGSGISFRGDLLSV